MFYLKDPSTSKPSATLTMAWLGITVALCKLFLAGFTCCGIKMSDFSGADFAMVVSPFLALLAHKRQVFAAAEKAKTDEEKET